MTLTRKFFTKRDDLAENLAQTIAEILHSSISKRGCATLAVSGGTTPRLFFEKLSFIPVEWHKVTITLVDERWVDPSHDRSNTKLVQEKLLQNHAKTAHFIPLWSGGSKPEQVKIDKTNARLNNIKIPFDAVILGLGTDGHTASFFPHSNQLNDALTKKEPMVSVFAVGSEEPRVTLTLPFLLKTNVFFLHIEGEDKLNTLQKAFEDGSVEDMPIRAILRQTRVPVHVYGVFP
jgi:6-phosphogluconolactonase